METKTTVIPREALERQAALCGEIQEYWQAQGVMPLAFVDTYGCQQNEADSERIRGMLQCAGYGLTDTEEGADVIVLNTCATPLSENLAKLLFKVLTLIPQSPAISFRERFSQQCAFIIFIMVL